MECVEEEEEYNTFYTSGFGTIRLLLMPNRSISSKSFMDSVVILYKPLTDEYINAVRLFCGGFTSSVVMCKILMVVIAFFDASAHYFYFPWPQLTTACLDIVIFWEFHS